MENIIYIVGIGPGAYEDMTLRAINALKNSDVIIGYTVYADLMRAHFPEKQFLTTPMRKEIERCRMAFERAQEGKRVAMICSGDAGVYGMAGLMMEIGAKWLEIRLEVVPGVTAALSGAALLGAPLSNDFCVLSLSDLLEPAERIQTKLEAAARADLPIVLYNPGSRQRPEHLKRACEFLLAWKDPDTVCGLARNIGREGESVELLRLRELKDVQADMFTTVFIGNTQTIKIDSHMVTLRGYRE